MIYSFEVVTIVILPADGLRKRIHDIWNRIGRFVLDDAYRYRYHAEFSVRYSDCLFSRSALSQND